jgi:hypothetical protein
MQRHLLSVVLLILAASPGKAQGAYTYPPEQRGAVGAVLEVRMAQRGPAVGQAAATYTIQLSGPANLEVMPVRLGDAAGAWKTAAEASSWSDQNGRVSQTLTVLLHQVKPGTAPLPDVRLRFREGPEAPWEEVEWLDVLRQLRDVPGPSRPAEPASRSTWWIAGLAGGVAALVLGLLLRRRRAGSSPVPAESQALAEVDRLEATALPPAGTAAAFHTQLSEIIRRYLATRFGLKALEQTTAEFLTAACKEPALESQAALLAEFCQRCDLAKFAAADLSAAECCRSAALARTLVEQTRARLPQRVSAPAQEVPSA